MSSTRSTSPTQPPAPPQEGAGASGPFVLPPGYDGLGESRRLLRVIRAGALATNGPEGFPFASLVTIATDHAGAPLLLLSGLSAHTRHLIADPRASILLSETGKGDPLAHPRLSLVGAMTRLEGAAREAAKARFLARHPKSALYADFGDFGFWRLEIARAHLNGGFAKAAAYDGGELLLDAQACALAAALEPQVLAELDAAPQTLARLAAAAGAQPSARWRATGFDPLGLDLTAGDLSARLAFAEPVTDLPAWRRAMEDRSGGPVGGPVDGPVDRD
jgi:putative heme iron utilization protein